MAHASPDGAYQVMGTIRPAETVDNSIWINAWPEAAVPRIAENLSKAASDSTGMASAIPILNNAIGRML